MKEIEFKKFYIKLRNLSLNFLWAFKCLSTLSYPIIDGNNEYSFDSNLSELANKNKFGEGIHFLCLFEKFFLFLKTFFNFNQLDIDLLRGIIFLSEYFVSLKSSNNSDKNSKNNKINYLYYDKILSLLKYSVLTSQGKYIFGNFIKFFRDFRNRRDCFKF